MSKPLAGFMSLNSAGLAIYTSQSLWSLIDHGFEGYKTFWPCTDSYWHIPHLHLAKSRHRLQLGHHRFQFYDKCKQVQVDLGHIKKVELFEKTKLLFSNLFLKISWIIVIDLHFFCSVNRSRNRIHVHQAWRAIFYCMHPEYWWPVFEFEIRIGAISVNSWF